MTVEDLVNVIFLDIVHEDGRRRRWGSAAREWVGRGWCELDDVEDRVEATERGWQTEAVRVWTDLGLDGERPEVAMG